VLTRQGFNAELQLDNSGQSELTDILVEIFLYDNSGNDASAYFSYGLTVLTGMDSVSGNGTLAPQTTGVANWLIIPRITAAPTPDTVTYKV
jgi:hypothetical protein